MGVNCNYIISNGLKTNKWWGEEKNKFWMRVHRNCYNWNGWKQTNGEEWKNLFRFFFSHPILYTSILKNNASKREDDESMVDSLPVSWRLYIFKGFFLLWIIRWLPTSKMPALWQIGETGETWMYCKGDYQLGDGIAHEDQAQWPCSPGDAEGPHWVPISLVTINFGHSACRKLRQDTVG